jgi:two-component system nitrogen regulation sensor histidine kinase GlnL
MDAKTDIFDPDLQSLLDALVDGVLLVDPMGRIRRVNAGACRMLETSEEAAYGRTLHDLLGPSHPLVPLCDQVMASGQPLVEDGLPIQRRYGDEVEISVSLSCIDEPDGGRALVAVLRDLTIFNSLHEQVSHEEQLISYGHIAAGIAHEVKNPLGGIRGAAELLHGWSEGNDRAQRTSDMIVREVDRITALVEELMVFARGETLDVERMNIHQLLDEVVHLVEHDPAAGSIRFERSFDPSIPEIEADHARLTQVFLNLARNAVQALSDQDAGGTLEITTRMIIEHRLIGRDGKPVLTVQISLRDTGPGIPPDTLARLATPFFTTKPKGTGLGLAVSQHWVKQHAGRLRIESEPGLGTTVHVELPIDSASTGPREAAGADVKRTTANTTGESR